MSSKHTGNMVPEITYEEHDGLLNAKKTSLVSAATIYAVVNTGAAGITNSIVTVAGMVGNVTLDAGSLTGIRGNLTLSDSKGFIGLTSVTGNVGLLGNVTLDSGSLVGLRGNVTIDSGNVSLKGNVTLDSGSLVGLRGNLTLDVGSLVGIRGNVTLSDSKGYIGLVTNSPAYGSNVTIFTQVISATGNTTVFVAPASNRFFIKNLHVSSLGRSELEIRSGATTIIPFTSLSTTSGFLAHYGEMGLPGRAQADGFVVNLNGGATISVMASVYFQA